MSNEDSNRDLIRKHQQLLRDWKSKKGCCIICAEREGNSKDHLPPAVLFPATLRTNESQFYTFPVCKECNRASSDEDFLLSVALAVGINQECIIKGKDPTDEDAVALYRQLREHLTDPDKSSRRSEILKRRIVRHPKSGLPSLDLETLPVNQTLTKIAKSIYWLHTDGDVLQGYNPAWWIRPALDTSKTQFIEGFLKTTYREIHWNGRFIWRCNFGRPQDGVGGFIACSLHFYTKMELGKGMSWFLMACPAKTMVEGRSIYDWCMSRWGNAQIDPCGAGRCR